MTDPVFRVLPTLDEPSAFFWTSGADGKLRFLRCAGVLVPHPSAGPDLPAVPRARRRARRGERAGHGALLHREPSAVGRHRRRVRDRARRRSTSSRTSASRRTSSTSSPTTCASACRSRSSSRTTRRCSSRCSGRSRREPVRRNSRSACHLRDRAVGDRAAPRPRRARPHDRGGARRDRRRRPHGRRHRRPRHVPGRRHAATRAASPVRARRPCRTRCACRSTGTAADRRARRRSRP